MPGENGRYAALMRRIGAGERILIDGATGTEVDMRGVPQLDHAWNGGGALTDPDTVQQVHEDYLRLGAEIVISNTFGTSLHALEDAGIADRFELVNRRSVELAVAARTAAGREDALVAGGVTHWSWTGRHPSLAELKANATRQIGTMADAGADLVMLEMMVSRDRTAALLEAAGEVGLPAWAGLTTEADDTGRIRLYQGEPLADMVAMVRDHGVPLISIMHTVVELVSPSLEALGGLWTGPVGAYAHSGRWEQGRMLPGTMISPAGYALAARDWLDRGVQVLGGCCGIGPDHIRALAPLLGTARPAVTRSENCTG